VRDSVARRTKLKCRNCGSPSNVGYAPYPGTIPGAATGGRFICGDCLYLEEHPDAAKIAPPARGKAKRTQEETLL
jgi:ribosomal protein S27AE